MKVALFGIFILLMVPAFVRAQLVNPTVIQQDTDIALHGKIDVYYCPMSPPADSDTRAGLCTMSGLIRDSNGLQKTGPYYDPITHGVEFQNWNPCTSSWGNGFDRSWQRLFTARDKPSHNHSDIIAGGLPGDSVIISKNEDVDFRASGTIKLESGFHVMPGAFFHAYTEPKWGDTVFSDDFNDSVIDRSKWYVVGNGKNPESDGVQCNYDTNVRIVPDPDATDGKALDIMLREQLDTCSCHPLYWTWNSEDSLVRYPDDTTAHRSVFSSAFLRTARWPMARVDTIPFQMAYQHIPYGKYEIREKTPHTMHHINNWLWGSFEIDMSELGWDFNNLLHPNLHHHERFGPFTGKFVTTGGTVRFISTGPEWSLVNQPNFLFIDNFAYEVKLDAANNRDTVTDGPAAAGTRGVMCWPTSLKDSTGPITFYYSRSGNCVADTVPWKVTQDDSGRWRIFSAPYKVIGPHDSLRFTKDYQPTTVRLHVKNIPLLDTTLPCHWDLSLNSTGDTGRILLDAPFDASWLDSGIQAYTFTINDRLFEYEPAAVPFEWGDSSYEYHTFGLEVLPNEMRFLFDSNVVLRLPDRTIPVGNRQYDIIKNLDRSPMKFVVGEFDLNSNSNNYDPFGTDSTISGGSYTSKTYEWRHDFEQKFARHWHGFDLFHGLPTAHKLIDYVKVWDVPAGTIIPNFPH